MHAISNGSFQIFKNKDLINLSLVDLVDEKLELIDFIIRLFLCKSEEVSSLDKLAVRIKSLPADDLAKIANVNASLIKNLIMKQFPNPGLDSLRELIANAMDANARAGRADQPVKISLQKDCLSMQDVGDGIGNILNFFIPGRSANAETLFNPEAGTENVTGRFGQGALSGFYYLYPNDSASSSKPKFDFHENSASLSFICYMDDKPYEVVITALISPNNIIITHCQNPLDKHVKRSLTIHTKHQERALKIKFLEKCGEIYLDIKEKPKKEDGTIIKIQSPLIEENEHKLLSHIAKVFKSSQFPLLLNGKQIGESTLRKIVFRGGIFTFNQITNKTTGGTLRICECGKLIADFELTDLLVPGEVTIDFKRLNLSQERASLDFKSPQTVSEMHDLIEKIVHNPELTDLEQNALLNALSPVIGADRFNLSKKIQIAVQERTCQAKDKSSENSENSSGDASSLKTAPKAFELKTIASLNPAYLSFTHLPVFYEQKSIKIYLGSGSLDRPISVIEHDGKFHLFLNEQLMPLDARSTFEFNCTLINLWLKNKGYNFHIDIPAICKQKFPVSLPTDEISQLIQTEPATLGMDWSKYDLKEQIPEENYISYFIEMFPKYVYPDDKALENGMRGYLLRMDEKASNACGHLFSPSQKDIEHYIKTKSADDLPRLRTIYFLDQDHSPDKIHYLADLFFSNQEKFTRIRNISYPEFMLDVIYFSSNQVFHEAIVAFQNFLNFYTGDPSNCIIFLNRQLSRNLKGFNANPIKFVEVFNKQIENYLKLKQIIKISGCRNLNIITQRFNNYDYYNFFNDENIVKLNFLAGQLANTEAADFFIEHLHAIKFHDFLLTLSKEHLIRFFEFCPDLRSFGLNEENYLHIHRLSLREDLSVSLLRKWINIYACVNEIGTKSWMEKSGYLFPLIETYINEGTYSTFDELDSLEKMLISLQMETKIVSSTTWAFRLTFLKESKLNPLPSFQARLERLRLLLEERIKTRSDYRPFPILTLDESFEWVERQRNITDNKSVKQIELAEIYRELWERCELLNPLTRPFVYAVLLKENAHLLSENFIWPVQWDDSAILLHDDPDLIDRLGSTELAKRRLQGAMQQSLQENFFVKEICKNSREAGADEIDFEVHCDQERNTVLIIRDNGVGMDMEGLEALKTPNISSKNQNGEDPNFGWGFYTVFRDFDEILITTSKDGKTSYRLALKKTGEGILRQYLPMETSHPIGTTIIMKSKKDPLLSLIKIHAEVASTCKYLKELKVLFQGTPIYQGTQSEVFQEEKMDDICLQLGKGEEGIYGKNVLLGPVPPDYTRFLPLPLQELFNGQGLKLRVFLSHARQTMNRSHLVVDESFLLKTRTLIAKASFNYFVKQWTEENKDESRSFFDILSEDYLNDFRCYNSLPAEEMLSIFNTINNIEETSERYTVQCRLMNYARNILNQIMDTNSLNPDAAKDINEIEAALFREQKKETEKKHRKTLQLLQDKYKDSSSFASLLSHYPMNENGLTFAAIRSFFKQLLSEQKILLATGDYDEDYIKKLTEEQIKNILRKVREQVTLKFDCHSNIIANKMADSVYGLLIGIKSQSLEIKSIDTTWHEKVLREFLQRAARYLGKEIKVEFYAAQDGCKAYTIRGGNQVFFNRCHYVNKFTELSKPDEIIKLDGPDFLNLLSNILETLSHELVHLEEDKDCEHTHDKHFREQLALKLEKLFVNDNLQESMLHLFSEALSVESRNIQT